MTKLCPRGKAAAKRKFRVYPSAYANAYASKICAGKIKDPSGVKRKDFRGPKPSKAMGGRIFKELGGPVIGSVKRNIKDNQDRIKSRTKSLESRPKGGPVIGSVKRNIKDNQDRIKSRTKSLESRPKDRKVKPMPRPKTKTKLDPRIQQRKRPKMMGGGMTMMPRAMYNKGGKIPTTPKEKTFAALAAPKDRITFADKIAGATGRQNKKGGGLMEATSRLRAQGLKKGGIARGCGAVMSDRRKKTKMY